MLAIDTTAAKLAGHLGLGLASPSLSDKTRQEDYIIPASLAELLPPFEATSGTMSARPPCAPG